MFEIIKNLNIDQAKLRQAQFDRGTSTRSVRQAQFDKRSFTGELRQAQFDKRCLTKQKNPTAI